MIAQNMSLEMLLNTAAALSISGHLCLDFPCLCAVVALDRNCYGDKVLPGGSANVLH